MRCIASVMVGERCGSKRGCGSRRDAFGGVEECGKIDDEEEGKANVGLFQGAITCRVTADLRRTPDLQPQHVALLLRE